MVNRTTPLVAHEHYHTFNRGNNKQLIFRKHSDYVRFMHLLYICNTSNPFNIRDIQQLNKSVFDIERSDTLVNIQAVCLMPNHFHLLLTPMSDGSVSLFMQKLGTAYSKYFNQKYDRTGGLFEGRYKFSHVDNDIYLKYIFSYIHLNPLSLKKDSTVDTANFLKNYPYSSLHIYTQSPNPKYDLGLEKIVSTDLFSMYFDNVAKVYTELSDWIQYRNDIDVEAHQHLDKLD